MAKRNKRRFANGGTVTGGAYTPDVDYGYYVPNGYDFTTPASHAASLPASKVYAEGGDVGEGRFTRTPAERRIVRERAIDQHKPASSEEWERFLGQHHGNPLSYIMEGVGRLDNRAGAASQGENNIYDAKHALDLIAPTHELGDKYGLPGQIGDALQTTANVVPGLGAAQRGLSGLMSPVVRGAMHLPDVLEHMVPLNRGYAEGGSVIEKLLGKIRPHSSRVMPADIRSQFRDLHTSDNDNMSRQGYQALRDSLERFGSPADLMYQNEANEQWRRSLAAPRPIDAYAGGGKVSKIISEVEKKFGSFQADRMRRAADETNLERISGQGLRKMFDPEQSGLYMNMPPGDFQDYAARLPAGIEDITPYPRAGNVPGAGRLNRHGDWVGTQFDDMTQDWYLDNLARHMETKGAYASPELIVGKDNSGLTNIYEHEGRHRMMAMDRLGDPKALVQLPNDSMRSLPTDERVDYLTQKYFPHGQGQLVVPQAGPSSYLGNPDAAFTPRAPRPIYSEPYQRGGKVLSKLEKAVQDLAKRVREPDSGFTYDPMTGAEPSGGYAASLWPERSHILPHGDVQPEHLNDYFAKNRDLLSQPGHYMGAWHDPASHDVYLDVSKVGPDLNEIAFNARKANQKAIFDLNSFNSIDVGGTGEALRTPPTYGPGFGKGGDVAARIAKGLFKKGEFTEPSKADDLIARWSARNAEAPLREDADPRISTRLPTATKSLEDPISRNLSIGSNEILGTPGVAEHNTGLIARYPGFGHPEWADMTASDRAQHYVDRSSENLHWLMQNAPQSIKERGPNWYPGVRNVLDAWSEKYGKSPEALAGVTSALSPQKDWYQNASLAERVLDTLHDHSNTPMTWEMAAKRRDLPALNTPKVDPIFDRIKGSKLSDLEDPLDKALWIRLHDEAHNPPQYRVINPEGTYGDFVTNADGRFSKPAWGSLNEIAKAVGSAESGGDLQTISDLMGSRHKVRNFYNNSLLPFDDRFGDITADTHAVAANQLRPLSGNSEAVAHNFGNSLAVKHQVPGFQSAKGSAKTGVQGSYGLNADPYRVVAEDYGTTPRAIQSPTWEAVRSLYPDTFKTKKNLGIVDDIWHARDRGDITTEQALGHILDKTGGFREPPWAQPGGLQLDPRSTSTYKLPASSSSLPVNLKDVPFDNPTFEIKDHARGGSVDDDLNLFQSQFYKRGGSVVELKDRVADDFTLYNSQFRRGGFFRR